MIRQHPLVSHPVGRLPALARWYLAGIAMLSLLLVAIHFAMQVYAQQEANRLVGQWSERFGISVEDVRYRMLRGALTLVDVRYQGSALRLYAPSVFLHGNLTSLASQHPRATFVEIRGADVSMSSATFDAMIKRKEDAVPELFEQLWRSSQRVGIYDTKLQILPAISAPFPAKPVEGVLVRFEASELSGVREMQALSRWQGGEVVMSARNQLVDGVSRFTFGELKWHGLDAGVLLRDALGLESFHGTAYGSVTWEAQDEAFHVYDLRGMMNISTDEGRGNSASVGWQGTVTDGAWQVKVNSTAWPVAMFSSYLPHFQGLRVKAGRFDGEFRLAGILDRWQMDVTESTLSGLHLDADRDGAGRGAQNEVSGWRAERVVLKNGTLQWPKRSIVVEQMELTDGDVVLDSLAGTRGGKPEPLQWKLSLHRLFFDGLKAVIQLSEERVLLPVLDGEMQWREKNRLSIQLHSPDPSFETDDEKWNIRGSGDPMAAGSRRLTFDVKANRAALARFRPLLPDLVRSDATGLAGDVALDLKIQAGAVPWQGSGEVSIGQAAFKYGGEQWKVDKAEIGIRQMGVAQKLQEIDLLDVEGWHYQAALRPLKRPVLNEVTPESGSDAEEASKAVAWEIKNLSLSGGTVAVGQTDALWMRNVSIQSEMVRPGEKIPVMVKAEVGGGSVTLKGDMHWVEALPTIREAKIMVRDVIPFFMNEWFTISNLPQINRGRLYADISVKADAKGEHRGMAYFRLQHGLLAPAVVEDDLLLSHVGFNAFDVFNTLKRSERLRIRVPLEGRGGFADVLGNSMVAAIKRKMDSKRQIGHPTDVVLGKLLSSVRLHTERSLSQNERVRLRTVVKHLLNNPALSIELRPQLSLSVDDADQVDRVIKTQKLIESFIVRRGVSASRIFPIWPHQQLKRSGSSSGIGIYELR